MNYNEAKKTLVVKMRNQSSQKQKERFWTLPKKFGFFTGHMLHRLKPLLFKIVRDCSWEIEIRILLFRSFCWSVRSVDFD